MLRWVLCERPYALAFLSSGKEYLQGQVSRDHLSYRRWILAISPWNLATAGMVRRTISRYTEYGPIASRWETFRKPQSPGKIILLIGSVEGWGSTCSAWSLRSFLERVKEGNLSQSRAQSRGGKFFKPNDSFILTQMGRGRKELRAWPKYELELELGVEFKKGKVKKIILISES